MVKEYDSLVRKERYIKEEIIREKDRLKDLNNMLINTQYKIEMIRQYVKGDK